MSSTPKQVQTKSEPGEALQFNGLEDLEAFIAFAEPDKYEVNVRLGDLKLELNNCSHTVYLSKNMWLVRRPRDAGRGWTFQSFSDHAFSQTFEFPDEITGSIVSNDYQLPGWDLISDDVEMSAPGRMIRTQEYVRREGFVAAEKPSVPDHVLIAYTWPRPYGHVANNVWEHDPKCLAVRGQAHNRTSGWQHHGNCKAVTR